MMDIPKEQRCYPWKSAPDPAGKVTSVWMSSEPSELLDAGKIHQDLPSPDQAPKAEGKVSGKAGLGIIFLDFLSSETGFCCLHSKINNEGFAAGVTK